MRLIDVANFCDGLTDRETASGILTKLSKQLTIDAVHVVRCRECKHYKPEEYFSPCILPQGLECANPDDFCSYGQRKEAGHD